MPEQAALPYGLKVTDAAAHVGVSPSIITRAISSGHLVAHYPTSHAVVTRDELEAWLRSTPTARPERASA